jgi:ribosome biogenesis GTPase A
LIGNKIDISENDRAVSRKMAENFCDQNGIILYFETSAKDGIKIIKKKEQMYKKLLKRLQNVH